jgi:hypothetical protein
MKLFDMLFGGPKKEGVDREAQAKEHFGGSNSVFNKPNPGDTSQYWEQARQDAARNKPKPSKPGPSEQQLRERDAMLSGNLGMARPPAQGTPSKEEELAAALSGNFGKVTQSAVEPVQVGNGAWGPYVPTERPPDSVLQGLNEIGFTVNAPEKSAGMPNSSFSSTKELEDHVYRVSNIEDEYLRSAFNQPAVIVGQQAGMITPPSTPVDTAMPVMHMEPHESAALTWEAYDSLNDQQKAAVDWNTLLINAREKDFSDKYVSTPTDEERAAYDAEVTRLFGAQGGSNRYAPNTIDLLSQLDVVQLGQDLDEYLSLERAIDDTQLADFKFSERDLAVLDKLSSGESYAAARSGDNIATLNTANVQAASNLIKTQLANPEAITADFDTLMYGGTDGGVAPLGFGDSVNDQMFQEALAVLGAEDVTMYGVPAGADPMSFVVENLALMGADEEMQSQFLQYVGQQAQMFSQYGSEEQKTMAALVNKRAGLGGG